MNDGHGELTTSMFSACVVTAGSIFFFLRKRPRVNIGAARNVIFSRTRNTICTPAIGISVLLRFPFVSTSSLRVNLPRTPPHTHTHTQDLSQFYLYSFVSHANFPSFQLVFSSCNMLSRSRACKASLAPHGTFKRRCRIPPPTYTNIEPWNNCSRRTGLPTAPHARCSPTAGITAK
jgi:hypothetical protein